MNAPITPQALGDPWTIPLNQLDVADLASAYLGAFSFERLADAFRAKEVTEGAIARASRLFATPLAPWCSEIF